MKIFITTLILFFSFNASADMGSANIAPSALPDNSIYNMDASWINQDGKKITLTDLRGKYVILSMVYLKCQFSCPLTVAQMKEVESHISTEMKSKVSFVLVSFDTEHDTPKELLKYAKKNKLQTSKWMFLTTKRDSNVRKLSTLIDFKYKKLPSGEYEHSYAIVALDDLGRIIGKTEGSEMSPMAISDLINQAK